MAYRIPTFNVGVSLWTGGGGGPPVGPARLITTGNLRMMKTAFVVNAGLSANTVMMFLCLPKLTDVRPSSGFGQIIGSDVAEVPTGSGRFYDVISVDDVARGFPNEYRVATLRQRPRAMPIT